MSAALPMVSGSRLHSGDMACKATCARELLRSSAATACSKVPACARWRTHRLLHLAQHAASLPHDAQALVSQRGHLTGPCHLAQVVGRAPGITDALQMTLHVHPGRPRPAGAGKLRPRTRPSTPVGAQPAVCGCSQALSTIGGLRAHVRGCVRGWTALLLPTRRGDRLCCA